MQNIPGSDTLYTRCICIGDATAKHAIAVKTLNLYGDVIINATMSDCALILMAMLFINMFISEIHCKMMAVYLTPCIIAYALQGT